VDPAEVSGCGKRRAAAAAREAYLRSGAADGELAHRFNPYAPELHLESAHLQAVAVSVDAVEAAGACAARLRTWN
jgi:hypothetical protein